MFRSLTRFQIVVDVGFALAFTVLFFAAAVEHNGVGATIVLLGYGVALGLRRLSPVLALGLSWICAIGQMAAGLGTQAGNIAILFVLFATAAYGSPRLRKVGLASVVLGGVVAALFLTFVGGDQGFLYEGTRSVGEYTRQLLIVLVGSWAVLGLSWSLGRIALANRTSIEEKHQRALAEMEQAQALQDVAVEHERNRIARDMHDIVAHSLAVVIAQADGARYARVSDPESVDTALSTISTTARDALRDVRGVLAQLRHNTDDAPATESQDLSTLVERMRTAGLRIDFDGPGDTSALGAGGQLTLYRIAQEALTNALRHGDSSHAVSMSLTCDDAGTTMTVRNRVRAAESTGGHGLIGMRERAALSGGTLTASLDEGVWTLVARLPAAEIQVGPAEPTPAEVER
ncbi:sensor histidine kinase [Rhodococcoides kyotonense]|uniref:histidine kinase n=1 Tax=Rhodococcoides kyotonense TaxID=398843 RepID=A0A239EQ09_9NOCA|nr:histidine kinase [Rhodococcus kyotonensis]SNS46725.1 Signal transduction histidine kinase [Rhodococcus kyotonensis]